MNIRSKLSSLREYLTPINHESNFRKTGEISPEEFVLAGDYLVLKFPTWTWGSGPKSHHKKFLPAEKQFLVTRHVPSYRRYASFVPVETETDEIYGESGENGGISESDTEWIPLFHKSGPIHSAGASEVHDLDELLEENVEDDLLQDDVEEYAQIELSDPKLRKYDLYIAYSTSYRVPKVYLVGFNGNGIPLLPPQMYEDISGDHKDKTATIEALPMAHNTVAVSIHPCKHSSVMKVFMEHARAKKSDISRVEDATEKLDGLNLRASEGKGTEGAQNHSETVGEDEGIRVDQYLVIFLKFIASVTPGIEYDFTMEAL